MADEIKVKIQEGAEGVTQKDGDAYDIAKQLKKSLKFKEKKEKEREIKKLKKIARQLEASTKAFAVDSTVSEVSPSTVRPRGPSGASVGSVNPM
jgi:polyribonucleotide nucleotidyltransferase